MLLSIYDASVISVARFWADTGLAVVLLALGAVLFVVVLGFILSPAGRPVPPRRRTGGFSRAIADRTDGDGGVQ
jgi:hypothetical protein